MSVRAELGIDTPLSYDQATELALVDMRAARDACGADAKLVMAHLFAQGGSESPDSERSLTMGGAGQVGGHRFTGWDYAALGHLHQAQRVGTTGRIRYSGSPLKYSFGESNHVKGVTLLEVSGGDVSAKNIPLAPLRDVVRIRGSFDELLSSDRFAFAESAYVEATYTDRGYLVDVAARLRQRFAHLLLAVPEMLRAEAGGPLLEEPRLDDHRALLDGFWQHVNGEAPGDEEHAVFEAALGTALGEAAGQEAA